jgi:hypothetical protein
MLGARLIVVPFALVSLAFLSDLSWLEPNQKTTTDRNIVFAADSATTAQKPERTTPTTPALEPKTLPEKSRSVIQMLEGRENDLIIWASIAVVFFAIGWIWGGNYYLRRDRARSRKLRF